MIAFSDALWAILYWHLTHVLTHVLLHVLSVHKVLLKGVNKSSTGSFRVYEYVGPLSIFYRIQTSWSLWAKDGIYLDKIEIVKWCWYLIKAWSANSLFGEPRDCLCCKNIPSHLYLSGIIQIQISNANNGVLKHTYTYNNDISSPVPF